MLVSCSIMAQWSNEFEFVSSSGYEYNIYKNPLSYSSDEDTFDETDLLINAPYWKLTIGDQLAYNWKQQSLELKGKVIKQFYKNVSYANNLDIYSRLRYQAEIEKFKLKLATYFINRDRNDLFEIDDKYRYPLPYAENKYFAEINYKLTKYIQLTGYSNLKFRNYKEIPDIGKTSYNEYLSGLNFKKRIRIKKRTYHYFYLNGEFANRNYNKKSFIVDEDIDHDLAVTSSTINWKYYRGEIAYKAKFGKFIKVKPGFKYEYRDDRINTKYQYNQYSPFLALDFEFKNTKISLDGEKRYRTYNRNIANELGEPKKYKYEFWKFAIKYTFSISNNFVLYLESSAYIKDSNYTKETVLSGRPYNYFKSEFGIHIIL